MRGRGGGAGTRSREGLTHGGRGEGGGAGNDDRTGPAAPSRPRAPPPLPPTAYVVIIAAPQRSVGRSANADALAAALVNAIQAALGPRQAVVRGLDVRDPQQSAEVVRLLSSHASARKLLSPGGGLAKLPSPLLYATQEGIFTKPGMVSLQLIVDVAEQVLGRAVPPALMRVVLEFPQRHDLRFCDPWANALEAAEAPEARISTSGVGPLGGGSGAAAGAANGAAGGVGLEAALRAAGYGEGSSGGGSGGRAGAGARNPQAVAAVAMGGGPIRATPPAAAAFSVMDGYTEMAVYESGGAHDDGGIPIVSDPGLMGGGGGGGGGSGSHEDGVGMDDLRAAIIANRSRAAGRGAAGGHAAKLSIEDRIMTSLPLDAVTNDAQLRERDLIPDTSPAATAMEIAQARRARHANF